MRLKALRSCAVFCLIVVVGGCGSEKHSLKSSVSPTANLQVALYSVSSTTGALVSVQFGPDTNYGLTTSTQSLLPGKFVNVLVAGMKASSTYHMRAVAQFADGTQLVDTDHTFTTGGADAAQQATSITGTTTTGKTPQSGIELFALASGSARPTVTDLSGNILWSYKAVPNGTVPDHGSAQVHFLYD